MDSGEGRWKNARILWKSFTDVPQGVRLLLLVICTSSSSSVAATSLIHVWFDCSAKTFQQTFSVQQAVYFIITLTYHYKNCNESMEWENFKRDDNYCLTSLTIWFSLFTKNLTQYSLKKIFKILLAKSCSCCHLHTTMCMQCVFQYVAICRSLTSQWKMDNCKTIVSM